MLGARVKHRKFGSGTIAELAGTGRDAKVKVDFDDETIGRKTLVIAQANLERGRRVVPVTLDDVRHIAALARLGVDDARARALGRGAEHHSRAHGRAVERRHDGRGDAMTGDTASWARRCAPDAGPPIPLARASRSFAPAMRDGFFLVPRLSTHEDPEAA